MKLTWWIICICGSAVVLLSTPALSLRVYSNYEIDLLGSLHIACLTMPVLSLKICAMFMSWMVHCFYWYFTCVQLLESDYICFCVLLIFGY